MGSFGTIDSAQWLLGSVIENLHKVESALAIIGFCYTTKLVLTHGWGFIQAARVYLFEPLWLFGRKRDWVRDYGRWAVITGATDGIGKEYAVQLAGKGMNIVLISRSLDKLNKVAREITTDFGVQTKVIVADFQKDISIYPDILKGLANIEVGLLVNNVGVFPPYAMHLTEMDPQNVWQHVTVNVGAATMMTRLVLPQMMERKKGGIINISSAASFCPTPLMCVYSATKMYINYFTEAVREDYSKYGITVQCLTPYYIATNMTSYSDRIGKPAITVPTARQYVRSALQSFGIAHTTTGYIFHALQCAGVQFLPTQLYKYMVHKYQLQLRHEGRASTKRNQ